MIDARECAALAEQCGEAAAEAMDEAYDASAKGGHPSLSGYGKAWRWAQAAEALSDAQEALQRAADAISAVGLEKE